jgi:hypothetical protein
MPHESLTVFYEELQKMQCVPAREVAVQSVLSFFSFLEQQDQGVGTAASPHEPCSSRPYALKRIELPPATYWAGPPSEIEMAIRAYPLARWGCLTRTCSPDEEIVLSPSAKATGEIRRSLAVLCNSIVSLSSDKTTATTEILSRRSAFLCAHVSGR